MYVKERHIEKGGLSVRKVEEIVKAKHKGFGPSRSTIHHYVVDLGLVGMSPLKPGPEGNIPALIYKSLCMAYYGSFLRINQINVRGGDNSRSRMIPILAEAMHISITVTYLTRLPPLSKLCCMVNFVRLHLKSLLSHTPDYLSLRPVK